MLTGFETSLNIMSSPARKCLFGPTDREETLNFGRAEIQKDQDMSRKQWNFDFSKGKPLEGAYEWQNVDTLTTNITEVSKADIVKCDDGENCGCERVGVDCCSATQVFGPLRRNRTGFRRSLSLFRQARITDFMRKRKANRVERRQPLKKSGELPQTQRGSVNLV